MSVEERRGRDPGTVDPDAEEEVDFGRYRRLLIQRWWLVAAGLVIGAIAGYAVTLGGAREHQGIATIYMGEPYSASGGQVINTVQTNPETVDALVASAPIVNKTAKACGTTASAIENGISVEPVLGLFSNGRISSELSIVVRTRKSRVAACAANALAREVIAQIATYPAERIANIKRQVVFNQKQIKTFQQLLDQSNSLSSTDRLLLQERLVSAQQNTLSLQQVLLQANEIEKPRVLTKAVPGQVPGPSHRNKLVAGAAIGIVLGVLAALFWDRLRPAFARPPE